MYIDFETYYRLGGKADGTAFPRLQFRAGKLIDRYTQNRVKAMEEVPQAVQMCLVELINAMDKADPTETAVSPALSGFNNDGYSESYAEPVTAEHLETSLYGIVREYLSGEVDDYGVSLLYLGVD